MDTSTGEIIQVVDNPEQAAKLHDALENLTDKIMTVEQVNAENTKRESEGTPKIEPIAKVPNPNCRRCHGRGHLGKDIKSGIYVKCVCVLSDDEAKARRCRIQAEELSFRRFGQK